MEEVVVLEELPELLLCDEEEGGCGCSEELEETLLLVSDDGAEGARLEDSGCSGSSGGSFCIREEPSLPCSLVTLGCAVTESAPVKNIRTISSPRNILEIELRIATGWASAE